MIDMTAQTLDRPTAYALGDLNYSTEPANLAPNELHAYRVGYDRGARAYLKKSGGVAITHDGDTPAAGSAARKLLARNLAELGRTYRAERHAPAHKAGMTALRSYLRKIGAADRLAEIVDPLAAGKAPRKARKPAARLVPVPSEPAPVAEPVERVEPSDVTITASDGRAVCSVPDLAPVVEPASVPDPMPTMTRAARKASRRELARTMRAAGVAPSGYAWDMACVAAGLKSADETAAVSA